MRPINEVIVHCSATRPQWMRDAGTAAKVAEIRRWHVQDNGWRDIGYHFVIDRDGTVARGRPVERTGAHTKGKNTGTIGVCLIGGHGSAATDKFEEHFSWQQHKALGALLVDLRNQFPTITRVSGHNQYAQKACPGFNVPSWYAAARAEAAKKA